MADGDANEEFQGEPAPAGKNPLLTIVMILNVIVLGVIAYFQFENHKKISSMPSIQDIVKEANKDTDSDKSEMTGEAKEIGGKLFPIEGGFTANLAQGDGPKRFIRTNLVLRISDESDENEVKQRKAQIRDSIITILNSKRPEDLLKVQGKEFLKEEIKAAINSFLVKGKVVDVYYVSFQIN
ncbi:flagellar basal body-associated FliL family protein [Halobacteriovorax sp. GB3]|uniref:flagellar basal body-associated FliL family protein n=1 Tax=Halobacteriovorax sp. GB3 TaxID=2719615 RepID=UPI00235E111E|nr:flagellar basal body-associated FliL family protein [Halobacteriovorax sp. GB3]MDD0854118.1 flagellar basal body-associated FliL family protein [Halobacteriovorax sp. GB3]